MQADESSRFASLVTRQAASGMAGSAGELGQSNGDLEAVAEAGGHRLLLRGCAMCTRDSWALAGFVPLLGQVCLTKLSSFGRLREGSVLGRVPRIVAWLSISAS